jgi:hypothetical protein
MPRCRLGAKADIAQNGMLARPRMDHIRKSKGPPLGARWMQGYQSSSELISKMEVHSGSDDVVRQFVRYIDISRYASRVGKNR